MEKFEDTVKIRPSKNSMYAAAPSVGIPRQPYIDEDMHWLSVYRRGFQRSVTQIDESKVKSKPSKDDSARVGLSSSKAPMHDRTKETKVMTGKKTTAAKPTPTPPSPLLPHEHTPHSLHHLLES